MSLKVMVSDGKFIHSDVSSSRLLIVQLDIRKMFHIKQIILLKDILFFPACCTYKQLSKHEKQLASDTF